MGGSIREPNKATDLEKDLSVILNTPKEVCACLMKPWGEALCNQRPRYSSGVGVADFVNRGRERESER